MPEAADQPAMPESMSLDQAAQQWDSTKQQAFESMEKAETQEETTESERENSSEEIQETETPTEQVLSEEETEEDTQEVEEPETDEEVEQEAATDEEPDEDVEIVTLKDLEEQLDTPLDDLETTITVDGEEQTVNLGELKLGYQREVDYRKKTQQLAEDRKALDTKSQDVDTKIQHTSEQTIGLLNQLQALIVPNMQSPEMQALRQNDPEEANRIELDAMKKQQWLSHMVGQVTAQHQEAVQKQQEEYKTKAKEHFDEQMTLAKSQGYWQQFEKANPGKDFVQVHKEFLAKQGVSEEQISMIGDEWHMRAIAAWRESEIQKAMAAKSVKKVRKAPKRAPDTKRKVKTKQSNFQKAKAKLKKSGRIEDAAAAWERVS